MKSVSAQPIDNEQLFSQAALQHWQRLGDELRADVDEFNKRGASASFSKTGAYEYRVRNPESGLEVRIVANPADHLVRYDFFSLNDQSAGSPEGGILSMRIGTNGVEFYSSDQPVTAAEARTLFLDPVLNPPAT
jgi:hypothetical protein